MDALGHIVSIGAHVPRLRLSRQRIREATAWRAPPESRPLEGALAICNWDEDSLTLAVEAARACLHAAPARARADVASLQLASITLPFADRSNAGLAASALDLPETLETLDLGGSLRAGTAALANACRRNDAACSLVVACDARLARVGSAQELESGAGAVACLIAPAGRDDRDAIATVLAAVHVAADFVDHYRLAGEAFDYALEDRWVRDEGYAKLVPQAISRAVEAAGLDAAAIRVAVLPGTAAHAQRIARLAGLEHVRIVDALSADCGNAGCAQPLLGLAHALEETKPGEHVLVVAFGHGVDALVVRAREHAARPVRAALARRAEETSYVRYLAHRGLLDVDFGLRAERDQRTAQSVAWRKRREVNAFVGGRCDACGTVQYPRSAVCVNPECRRPDTQQPHRLADSRGRVKSFTEDWQAYSPRPPYIYGNIEFEEGGNLLMELTDLEPGELAVGTRVRFVYRIKDVDRLRRFKRYFWKATPS